MSRLRRAFFDSPLGRTHYIEAGPGAFLLEPVFHWPGSRTVVYARMLDAATLGRFRDFPENPEVAAFVSRCESG
jgi:hypothetical protein